MSLAELFGDHDTLIVYSYMFGPAARDAVPDVHVVDGRAGSQDRRHPQRVAIVFTARSPIERLVDAKKAAWLDRRFPVYTDTARRLHARLRVSADDADMPGYNVFTRRDGVVRHFWSDEIGFDDGRPRPGPARRLEIDPLWMLLDTTPEGRGTDWYPSPT